MFNVELIILYQEARPSVYSTQRPMNYEVFPVLLVGTNTVSCVSVVYSFLFSGWLSPLSVVVTVYAWTDQQSNEYSRETFCSSLEFSLYSSLLFVCVLQILLALISPDSQEYLLTSANLPGCRVPLPSARPGSSQGNTLVILYNGQL